MRADRTPRGVAFKTWADAAGPWAVLTHGAFLSSEDFRLTAEALSSRFKVICWDLPGHGATALPLAPPRLRTASDALAEVLDHVEVSSAIHLGFSFGGMVAQDFARHSPERVRALVAYGCVPIFQTPTHLRPLIWAMMRLQFLTQPWASFVETFARQASQDESLQRELEASMKAQPHKLRDAIWEAMLFSTKYEPDFRFSCPVGHIMGENDNRFPGAYGAMKAFARSLPDGHAIEISGAGHMAHRESPSAYIAALHSLIDRLLIS